MARFLVFNTRAAALRAEEAIWTRMRDFFATRGFTVVAEGIVGRRVSDRQAQGLTRRWAEPRQRLDGQWVIPHPETHPLIFDGDPTPRQERIIALFDDRVETRVTIEEEDPATWWPRDPRLDYVPPPPPVEELDI